MKIWMQSAIVAAVAAALCSATAHAQTDAALSGFRTLTSSSTGSGTTQTPTDSEGALFELRHIVNPLVGYEFNYSYAEANEAYIATNATLPSCYPTGPTGTPPACQPLKVSGKANQFGVNWIFSVKSGNLRPFALGGIGLRITVPGSSPYSVNTVVRPAFVYGGGVDWSFAKHLGLRLQVQGNMTKAPNLSDLFNSTTKYTQIYEPMGGVFYRF
ncbi:MAG: hypothetical protein ABSB50_14360 [Terracidiphilus sp.]|jgi:hypothetical protein